MRAFGADDADAAAMQPLQQAGDIRLLARQRAEIQHHGTAVKERGRALDLRIERIEPVFHGRFGRKDERHERTAADSDERTRIGCWHLSGRTKRAACAVNQNRDRLRCKKKDLWIFRQILWKTCGHCESRALRMHALPSAKQGRVGCGRDQAGDSTWMTRLAIISRVFAP